MASSRILPLNPRASLEEVLKRAADNLSALGYSATLQMLNPTSATLTVAKDREGFKNIIGLGIECKATLNVMNSNQLNVNIDSEWTNKVVAIAVGWFVCFVPFITGIIGAVNQNGLPAKIYDALMASTADANIQ